MSGPEIYLQRDCAAHFGTLDTPKCLKYSANVQSVFHGIEYLHKERRVGAKSLILGPLTTRAFRTIFTEYFSTFLGVELLRCPKRVITQMPYF
jgi:hypothetical protein